MIKNSTSLILHCLSSFVRKLLGGLLDTEIAGRSLKAFQQVMFPDQPTEAKEEAYLPLRMTLRCAILNRVWDPRTVLR